jgi:hypothetical protein
MRDVYSNVSIIVKMMVIIMVSLEIKVRLKNTLLVWKE